MHLFDLDSGKTQALDMRGAGDFPAVGPHFAKVAKQIRHASLSPTGMRAVFEAHGNK